MLADRYELHREIGRGGMGSVWLGHDTVLGRDVAIKQIGMTHAGAEPDLQRAEREAHLAARINHQNVVAVYDLVDDSGHQWLVMEFVDGPTLAGLIAEREALSQGELAPVARQVAGALAAAHEHGIVHRDVKPSNILLKQQGVAKLSDFGIARAQADASLTQTGMVTGSPAYLSPEVASGRTATAASDVWSLGATVFHALAGKPPYSVTDNLMGAMYRIVHDEPPALDLEGPLPTLVAQMMQHDPAARPTMAAVEKALLEAADDLPAPGAAAGAALGAALGSTSTQSLDSTQAFDAFAEPGEPTVDTAFRPLEPPVTQEPAPTAIAPTLASPPPSSPPPPAAPSPTRRAEREPREPRGTGKVVAGVAAVLAVVALLTFLGLRGGGDDQTDSPPTAASTEPSNDGAEPSDEESESPADDGPVTVEALEGFVSDYLMAASTDPDAGFTMLTPEFQAESNGIDGYKGFWGKVDNLNIDQVSADPESLSVSYTYSYDFEGSRRTESVSLQLVESGDSFLIAGEA